MPPRYKDVDECRRKIRQYIGQLESGTDDSDADRRNTRSTTRYKQDLRWYDHWLDDAGIDEVVNVTPADSNQVGQTLAREFNGTTPLYRWDRIYAFHDWLERMDVTDTNPFERWDADKAETFGLTKSTAQSRQLEDEEKYAVSQDDIRRMEESVGRNRVRDQLVIRLMWQTGIRRGEASGLLIDDIDRDAREVTVRPSIAKNGVERVVAYQQSLDGLLKEWLDYGYREEMAASGEHDRLFTGERGAPLSGDRINDIVINAACEANLNRKIYADANAPIDEEGERIPNRWKISSHNVRHGYGSYLANETDAGIWEISKQMGHSSVEITEQIYVEDDPRAGIEHGHKFGPE